MSHLTNIKLFLCFLWNGRSVKMIIIILKKTFLTFCYNTAMAKYIRVKVRSWNPGPTEVGESLVIYFSTVKFSLRAISFDLFIVLVEKIL